MNATKFNNICFNGNEAIEVYKESLNHKRELAFTQEILAISYKIHIGDKGELFINKSFDKLKKIIDDKKNDADLYAFFQKRRLFYKKNVFNEGLSNYKNESLKRSIKIIGCNNFEGIVLDLGANDNLLGKVLKETQKTVKKVIGVDIKKRNPYINEPFVSFVLQDSLSKIPVESLSIDSIVIRFALHHMDFDNQQKIIQEAYRVLKNRGKLIIVEDTFCEEYTPILHNRLSFEFQKLSYNSKLLVLSFLDASSCFIYEEEMPFYFSYRSIEEWRKILEEAGFKERSIDYWGIPFFSLFQAPLGILIFEKKL